MDNNKLVRLLRVLRADDRLFAGTPKEQKQITGLMLRIKHKLGHHIPNNNGSLNGCIICSTDQGYKMDKYKRLDELQEQINILLVKGDDNSFKLAMRIKKEVDKLLGELYE